jgi:hypothetical protein
MSRASHCCCFVEEVTADTTSFSKDSRSITWHQWHVEYPAVEESRSFLGQWLSK